METVRWHRKMRNVDIEGMEEPEDVGNRAVVSLHDEVEGLRFSCPTCGRMDAVLRRSRREAPMIGIDYWLLCLSWRCKKSYVFVRYEDLQAVLATFLGGNEVALILSED
jgi:predicted RNA-binding Zn-ribbon protein involved in translation (DUF1610 family)